MKKPSVHPSAVLFPGASVRGDVTLEREVSVWPGAALRGDLAPIRVGEGTNIQENAVVHVDEDTPTVIGKGVTVGHGAILHGCRVGDNTVVGMGAILLSGAVVGENCTIGAGSLVTGKTLLPPGTLAYGSPARPVRALTEEEIEKNRENARAYLALLRDEEDQDEI